MRYKHKKRENIYKFIKCSQKSKEINCKNVTTLRRTWMEWCFFIAPCGGDDDDDELVLLADAVDELPPSPPDS